MMQRFALSVENRYLPTAEKGNDGALSETAGQNYWRWYKVIRSCGDIDESPDKIGLDVFLSELKSIPGAGWSMQCKNFIFLQRSWEIDRITLKENVDYWSSIDLPFQLLIFPEGTNFCIETKAKSDNFAISNGMQPLEHLLQPRTTGVVYLISELCERGALDSIYDVTVAYPDHLAESETDFVKGHSPEEVHYHIKRYDVNEPCFPRDQKSLAKWVYGLWEEKEQRLAEYFSPNRKTNLCCNTFPGCILYNLTMDKCCLLYAVMVFWLWMFKFIEYTCNGVEKLQSKVWLNRSQFNGFVN
ncbi:Lysocardiolipin acyltransferase [Trichinella pseudospiralis]